MSRTKPSGTIRLPGVLPLAAVAFLLPPPAEAATRHACKTSLSQYRHLERGMTLDTVVSRLGCRGRKGIRIVVGDRVRQTFTWHGRGTYGANANLTFTDGRLSDKSQLGLK